MATSSIFTDVLILGGEGVGKTLLVKQLKRLCDPRQALFVTLDTKSTTGVELEMITYAKTGLVIREVGSPMAQMWSSFFADCMMIMYVIDASNGGQLGSSVVELLNIIGSEATQNKPIIICINKIDAHCIVSRFTIEHMIRLEDLRETATQDIALVETSALNGTNLQELLRLFVETKKIFSVGRTTTSSALKID